MICPPMVKSLACDFAVFGIAVHADEAPAEALGDDGCRAAADEGIKYDPVLRTTGEDANFDQLFGEDGEVRIARFR